MKVLVPKGFDLTSIEKCLVDVYNEYFRIPDTYVDEFLASLDPESLDNTRDYHKEIFDLMCKSAEYKSTDNDGSDTNQPTNEFDYEPLMLYTSDYFIVSANNFKNQLVRCKYRARNYVSQKLPALFRFSYTGTRLEYKDHIYDVNNPPFLYFIREGDEHHIHPNTTDYNTVVAHYSTRCTCEFARITRSMNVHQQFFVVYDGGVYECFDAMSSGVSYVYSAEIKARVIDMVRSDVNNIKVLIEEDKHLDEKRPTRKRDPDFMFVDYKHERVCDDDVFILQMPQSADCSDLDSDDEMQREWDMLDLFEGILFACVGYDGNECLEFTCKTIDGIVYLKTGNKYLYIREYGIGTKFEMPTRNERIQIHYTDDGLMCLTAWDGDCYVFCEWLKASYGSVCLNRSEWLLRWGTPLKLKLIKK